MEDSRTKRIFSNLRTAFSAYMTGQSQLEFIEAEQDGSKHIEIPKEI